MVRLGCHLFKFWKVESLKHFKVTMKSKSFQHLFRLWSYFWEKFTLWLESKRKEILLGQVQFSIDWWPISTLCGSAFHIYPDQNSKYQPSVWYFLSFLSFSFPYTFLEAKNNTLWVAHFGHIKIALTATWSQFSDLWGESALKTEILTLCKIFCPNPISILKISSINPLIIKFLWWKKKDLKTILFESY